MKSRIIQDDSDPAPGPGPATRSRPGWVARHRLTTFFVLAFVLAWWSWPLHHYDIWPRQEFQAVGALIAALVVIALAEGRAGFADLGWRMIRWRVPWYFYAFALGLPLVVRLGTSLLNNGPDPQWSQLGWTSFLLAFLLRLVNPMDGPMAEEPAWRGFAVPRLQATRSPLASAAILGLLVALWHLPLIGAVGAIGLVTTFVITIVYSWLFNRTGGSVLLVLLFHDAQGFLRATDLGYTGAGLTRQELLECAAWTVVALALVILDRDAWRTSVDRAD